MGAPDQGLPGRELTGRGKLEGREEGLVAAGEVSEAVAAGSGSPSGRIFKAAWRLSHYFTLLAAILLGIAYLLPILAASL